MSFIRPEARASLSRWSGVLIGLGVLALGLVWLSGIGLLQWVGGAVSLAGIALIWTGAQRARFRAGKGGPGVVQIDEGEVSYFGPLAGGSVALRDLTLIALDPRSKPPVWVLRQPGGEDLYVPVNAEGAEALFDAFSAVEGLRTEYMLATLNRPPAHPVVIWQKGGARLH